MQIQSITGWQDHILTGQKYLQTANSGLSRPAVFNNELVFQLAAMAIEKIFVGMSQYHQQMPTDHTLSGLVECLSSVCPLNAEMADKIKGIEQADDICALTPVRRTSPDDMDVKRILEVGHAVASFAEQHVPWNDTGGSNEKR